jgi:phosphoribosylglycinamide formyltransferase 1
MTKIKIAILASGSGSNAENVCNYFQNSDVEVTLILTNNPSAFVIERAKKLNVPYKIFSKEDISGTNNVIDILRDNSIDLIVLAGYLWLIPTSLVEAYPNKIINIHPALLPKFGGKGMYGDRVHTAVKENGESESGISIHYVNDHYDEGAIIAQYSCKIEQSDTVEMIANKVHKLEYDFFPKEIEKIALDLLSEKI